MYYDQIWIFRTKDPRFIKVAKKIGRAARYRFAVWETDKIFGSDFNAALTDGGDVAVTRKMLAALTWDELAFVVAHEIAHLEFLDEEEEDQETFVERINRISNGRNSMVLGLIGAYLEEKFESRERETEMDVRAVQFMYMADFDIEAAIMALEKVYQPNNYKKGFFDHFMATHPSLESRIAAVKEEIHNIAEEFDNDEEDEDDNDDYDDD